MDNRFKSGILIIVSTIIALSFLLAGCEGPGSPDAKHYSGKGISFDYPKSWVIADSTRQNGIVTITNSDIASVTVDIESSKMPTADTMLSSADAFLVAGMAPDLVISKKSVTINGVVAWDTLFQKGEFKSRFVTLIHDNSIYAILCAAPQGVFDDSQQAFQMIIGSVKFK
jgi:predicted Zn-dependent protease